MPPLSLHSRRLIIGTLTTVTGEVDATNAARLETYLGQQIRPGEPLLLDLSALTFLDSLGLYVLIRLNAALREQGGALHLAAVHDTPARLLKLTGVWMTLNIHAGVRQAITSMQGERLHPQEPA
jgi:anti-anti-sigma factor